MKMKANDWILGLDIGGTNLRFGLVDHSCCLEGFEIYPSSLLGNGGCLASLERMIRDYCSRHLDGAMPRAVSAGFPSTIDREKKIVLSTPNLPGMNHLPVVETLKKALHIPVFIDRDVNLLLLNDIRHFALPQAGVIIGCYFGTGLGNAICINGAFLTGKNGVAGELGHVPVIGCRRICGCGNEGCLETLASGKYLLELQQRLYPSESVAEMFLRHREDQVLQEYVDMLAVSVATEINILDPDEVIIGGGVPHMSGFPWELLRERILFRSRKPYPSQNLEILLSADYQESGVLGAGLAAWNKLERRENTQ